MCLDKDIKIASDRPSEDVKRNKNAAVSIEKPTDELAKKAKQIGQAVAQKFIEDAISSDNEAETDFDLKIQRRLLLSFTATVGFEQYIKDDALSGIAQKSFLDAIKKHSVDLYKTSSDTGAFSFYYLAYRRGQDTERRVGQTFAMLCSHDGDPIFQELGEALYCWFSSAVRNIVSDNLKI